MSFVLASLLFLCLPVCITPVGRSITQLPFGFVSPNEFQTISFKAEVLVKKKKTYSHIIYM